MAPLTDEHRKRTRLILALVLALVLSLCLAKVTSAHGSEGDGLSGPAPAWMIALTFVQLFVMPAVGVWLVRVAVGAWLRPTGRAENQGAKRDTVS